MYRSRSVFQRKAIHEKAANLLRMNTLQPNFGRKIAGAYSVLPLANKSAGSLACDSISYPFLTYVDDSLRTDVTSTVT
jgi:hypothetical protein